MSSSTQGTVPEIGVIGLRRCSRGALLGGTALRAAALVVLATQAKAQLAPGAHPSGGVVVGGSAAIAQNGSTTDITQKSGRAAIDWQSFNVGSGARVVFAQPSSRSVALNTVVGPNPSEIAGRITANGVVAIVNQSGVIFDQGAQVDTAGLVVSAAGITRQNFMAGHMVFDQAPHPGARVVNNGAITIQQAGLAALVAPQVVNNGVITAKLGRVILGGATTYTLDLYGDGLLALNVTGQVTQVSLGGRTMPALVTNAGTILADGGTVVLNASAADGLIRTLVEAGGSISASSVGAQSGRVLVQGVGGSVDIAGAVSAAGASHGTVGGTIVATATGTVSLAPTARLDASGASGGGLVAVGTTAARARSRSAHATLTAAAVDVAAGASLTANATTAGNGGHVTLLSTGLTSLAGVITVQGGAFGGNGGMAEVSGDVVSLPGSVNARAPAGAMGGLLIDPLGIVISDSTPAGISPATHFTPAQLQTAGASANVTLTTETHTSSGTIFAGPTGDIDFAYSGPVAGSIHNTLALPNGLTVLADGNINIDKGFSITGGSISLTASAGAISFDTAIGAGLFTVAASATSAILSGSAVTMQASTNIPLAAATITGTTSISLSATAGAIAGTGVLTAGTLTVNAATGIALTGSNAITQTGAIDDTTAGNITIDNGSNALTIGGSLTSAGNVTLSTGALTVASTIKTGGNGASGTVSLTVDAGVLDEQAGTILAGTLTGSVAAGGANFFSTSNSFTTLGAFAANGSSSGLLIYDRGSVDVAGAVAAGGGRGLFLDLVTSGSTLTVTPVTGSLAAGNGTPIGLGADDFSLGGSVTTTGLVAFGRASSGPLNIGGLSTSFGIPGLSSVSAGTLVFGSISTTSADFNTTSIGITQNLGAAGHTIVLFTCAATTCAHPSDGGITEASTSIITAAVLEGSASNDVSLNGPNLVTTLGSFSSGGSLALTNAQSLLTANTQSASTAISLTVTGIGSTLGLGGTLSGLGVTFISTGAINQTAGEISTTDLAAVSSAGSINLGLGANAFAAATTMDALTSVTLNDGQGFAINAPINGTAVSLTAAGTISQGTGGVITATSLTGSASGDVALTAVNAIGALGAFSTASGGFSLNDTGTPTLAVTGLVHVDTGATAAGPLLLEATSLNVTGTGSLLYTGGVISLASNARTLTGGVTTGAAGLVGIDRLASGTLSVAASDYNNVTTGTLSLGSLDGSTTGSLTEIHITGALSVPDTLELFASGSLTAVAGISVGTLSGHVGTASFGGTEAVGTLKNFTVDSGGLTLLDSGSLILAGTIVATGGALVLDAVGDITERTGGVLSGAVTATSLTGSASGSIDLGDSANSVGTIATRLVASGGPLVLTDSTGLAVNAPVTSGGGLTLSVLGSGHALALDSAAALTAHGTLVLNADGSLTEDAAASLSATTLTGTAGNGLAGGSISLIGSNLIGTLGPLSSGAALTLDDGMSLTATGSVSAAGALAITVGPAGTLSIGTSGAGDSITGSSVALSSAGQLTQFNGGSITGTSGNVSLTSVSAGIGFGGTLAATSGGVQFAALSGAVTETDGTNAGAINAGSVSGTSQSILLTGANAVATLTALDATAGNLTIDDASASPTTTTAGTLISSGTLAITLSGASTLSLGGVLTAPTVGLTAPASIVQASGGVTATALTAVSSGGAVALTSAANQVGTLGASSAHTGFAFTDSATTSGSYHGTLTETGPVTAGSLSTLGLRAPALTVTGSLAAPGGTIALATDLLDLTGNVSTGAGTGVVGIDTFTGSTLTIGAGDFASVSTGILALGSLDGTTASGHVTDIEITSGALALPSNTPTLGLFTTATGTVNATAGIAVSTLIGNAGTVTIAGATSITTLGSFTAASFSLTQAGDLDVTGPVAASAATLSAGNLTIPGSVTGSTTLVLIATSGTITEAGTLNTALLSGSAIGTAALTGSNSVTSVGNFTADGFALTDGHKLSVTGNIGGGAGGVDLTTTGVANLDITGSLATSAAITLSAGGTIGEAGGGMSADTLTGSAGTSADLSGANTIGTLSGFTATSLTLHDGAALSVAGPVTSAITALQANSIDITGAIDAATSLALTATAGRITEEGSLTTGSLTGSSGTFATGLTGANAVTDLGDFVANGFNFDQTPALNVTGNVQAGASAIFSIGGSLGIAATTGTIAATSVTVTAASIAESGSISATTLTGVVTGDASLAGANTITSVGNLSAATIELGNSTDLTLTGSLTGTQSIALALSAGTLTVGSGATVTGSVTSLSASAMNLLGTIDAATSLTLSATGTIEQSGFIATPLLDVSAVGTAAFGSSNAVGTLGTITVTGTNPNDVFIFSQTGSLTLAGPITGDAIVDIGSLGALTDTGNVTGTAISLQGSAISIGGTVHGSASVGLTATSGSISEFGGSVVTPELTGGASAGANFSGSNTISVLGPFSASNLTLLDAGAPSLTTVGNITVSGALSLTAPALSLGGTVTAGSAFLSATAGTISGSIGVTGSLTGTSTGSTDLAGAIASLGSFTAAGFTLNDTGALSVTGPVSGGSNLSIDSAGALTIGGAVGATNVSLTGLSILISATGSVGASGVILSAFGDTTPGDGTIVENAAGVINAAILSGSAQGSASLVGVNAISTLSAFSAAPLTLHDGSPLTIAGSVTGSYTPSGGSSVFGSVALDLPGQALTISGTLNATGEAVSIDAGSVAETGRVIAASLTGTTSGATSLSSASNAISALGSYTAAGFVLDDSVTLLFVNGPVQGGASASIGNFGTSIATGNVQVDGTVAATAIALHADQQLTIAAGGTLTGTSVALTAGTGANTGGLTEAASASIDAATLTGSVQGTASLIGANSITTLGSFTATGGLTLHDNATLTILGPIAAGPLLSITTPAPLTIGSGSGAILSAATIALSAGNITIDGIIDATTSLSLTATDASSAGTIAEIATTALQTPLLALTAPGAVNLLGAANLIGSTGAASVGNLQLVDAEDFAVAGALTSSNGATITDAGHSVTVTGSIAAIDTNVAAGDIAVPGSINTATLELAASATGTATGTISAPGALIATTVTGSATGSASLVSAADANQIQNLGNFTAAGFALNDSTDLIVAGGLNGGASTGITADGLLTVSGSIAGGSTALTGDGIALTGTLTATNLALFSGSSITGTGSASITATSLTGSAAAAVVLTGANTITNLGSFTATGFDLADSAILTIGGPLQGGPSIIIDDALGLSVTGSIAGVSTSLTATSLDVPGAITATTLALSIGGTLTETGVIDTTLLDGSIGGSAAFLGTNEIGTLGAFTAAGLTFNDTTDIVIAGPVTSGATTLTAADIDIPGTLTATNLVVSTAGSIAEGGTLTVTGTLSGSAGGSAAFTGSNSIVAIAGFTSSGLTLDDNQALLVLGPVNGNASVSITDTGLLTVQGGLTGAVTSLSAAALDVPGTITAGTSLAVSVGGTIAAGGSIVTPLLTGSASGSAVFSGANTIDAFGPFTAAGLVLNDTPDLAVVGPVDGQASVAITDQGALSVQSSVTGSATSLAAASIDIPGSVSATTLALTAATGGITEAGGIAAGTLTGMAATSAALTGSNSIGTLGDFTAPTGFVLNDTPDLAVTGAVSGGPAVTITDAGVLTLTGSISGSATALTGSSINILDPVQSPGSITAADTLVLTATGGTITETGSITTALLSGSATGDATLTGTNRIANLGDFTAANLALADTSALTVTGSVTAATVALAPAALTVTGTLDAPTEIQVTTPGSFSSTGTIITALLAGSVTGDAALTGADLISTLGAFSAASFTLLDQSALTVTGPVVGTASLSITDTDGLIISGQITGSLTSLTAATIDIPGGVTSTSASFTSSGSLTETGSIVTGTLALSAGGSASLTGSNSIATLGDLTAAGLMLDNTAPLTVNGAVNGQTSVVLADAAALTIAGSGSITGSSVSLSAASMTVAGLIDAGTGLSLSTPGSIGETGSIATPHLTGSVGGDANFNGVNRILAVGDFSTGGGFALTDASGLSLDGMLNAVGGNIAITVAGNITQASSAVTGTGPLPGDAATVGTITLATTGTIALAGLTDAPTILLGDTASTPVEVTWSNNTIVTGSSVKPAAHHPAFPANNGTKPGVFVLTDKFAQTGTSRVNPKGRASVIDITLAKRGGTVSFDPSYTAGLVAPSGELFLNLKFGIASGHIDVAGLSLSFVLPGSASLTDLYGTIDNETGPAAAGAAYIVQPNSEYRFNSCPIQSINCILVSPVIVPITNPVEDVEVTTPRRRRDDDDLIIPNVGEQDF
jgi:filamentous hemagglutinin family protein